MVNPGRYTKLDGLRGLLSLVVTLNHSFLVIAIPTFANVWRQNYLEFHDLQSKIQQILMILGNGGVAVTAFFILSGLVLGQSLGRSEMSVRGLGAFYLKRLLRLYPVYIFLILLTTIYMKFFFTYQIFPHASTWYLWWMNFQMTFGEFIYNFFFIHTYLGGVTWTLRVILLASFLMPIFYLLTLKTSRLFDLFLTAILIYAGFTVLNFSDFRDFRYLYMFVLGLILPKFKTFFSRFPAWYLFLTLPISLILLFTIRYATDEYRGGVVEAFICWKLIALILYSDKTRLFDFLNHRFLQFFGQISYSLYLIHFSVLYLLARLMFQHLPVLPYESQYLALHILLFFSSLIIATWLSSLVHRFVELPSLLLANHTAHKLSKS